MRPARVDRQEGDRSDAGATRITRYDPAGHGMLEVRDQVSEYEPPYELPLIPRASPFPIENPLAAIHDEIAAFLREP